MPNIWEMFNWNNNNYDVWNADKNWMDMGVNDDPIGGTFTAGMANKATDWDSNGGNIGASPAMDKFNGNGGWGSLGTWGNVIKGFSGIADAWLGYENLKLNQERFDASKDMWNANYAANRQTTNNRIVDQATSRLGATGGMAADSMSHVKNNKLVAEVTV